MNDIGSTVVALCDQPLIDTNHYRELIAKVGHFGCFAAATEYPEGLRVPACFSLSALKSLSLVVGDTGAKTWLREQTPTTIARVTCPEAAMDIDTEFDYQERLHHAQAI
jgi:CTP:molybdopterin cytidylyltransferase MocA